MTSTVFEFTAQRDQAIQPIAWGDIPTTEPFESGGSIVAGFSIIEAPDHETALAIARTTPVLGEGGGVEVRPVHGGGVFERS